MNEATIRKRRPRIGEMKAVEDKEAIATHMPAPKSKPEKVYAKGKKTKFYQPDWSVWDIINKQKALWRKAHPVDIEDVFNYIPDGKRIKQTSMAYRDLTIVEAFQKAYPNERIGVVGSDEEPVADPIVGQIITVKLYEDHGKLAASYGFCKTPILINENIKPSILQYGDRIDAVVERVDQYGIHVSIREVVIDKVISKYLNDPTEQRYEKDPKSFVAKNLQLVRGGYLCDLEIDELGDIFAKNTIRAFIPGSHIALNATTDFEQYNGGSCRVMIIGMTTINGNKSVICSHKEYLKYLGDVNIIKIFKDWCDGKEISKKVYRGFVTGIINSAKHQGVFVEIPILNITGMINEKPENLLQYKPDQPLDVSIEGFVEPTYFDEASGQNKHIDPYVIEDGIIKKVNVKPILFQPKKK